METAGGREQRAVLLFPPGLDFITAFLGCLYAGTVAVPTYPPRLHRANRRLGAVAASARPALVLTTPSLLTRTGERFQEVPELSGIPGLTLEQVPEGAEESWTPPAVGAETLAFLQYTSGSTSDPKGVMVSHGNLLHNEEMICRACHHTEESTFVSWLPMYHDMGLIGGVLQPLYLGALCVLMSPVAFLQRPMRWLRAISGYVAHTSGAPNFAYDLCVRKSTPQERAEVQLGSWRVAFNGSEPVRSDTLERFTAAFEPSGFRRGAFFPCYGLAEATLIVTGSSRNEGPPVRTVRGKQLDAKRVVEAFPGGQGVRHLVGCGGPVPGVQVAIVDPETARRCGPGEVGEIWLAGPNVAQGYWQLAAETELVFRAFIADSGEGPFLRTGDFGFQAGTELFVTGRLRDLVIVRGVNHYPQDIELTVERQHPLLRPGCGAAFAVQPEGDEEELVVVQEVERRDAGPWPQVLGAVVEALVAEHEVRPGAVVLIEPGTLPKTSSGKVQRFLCREQFLEGSLRVVAQWRSGGAAANAGSTGFTAPDDAASEVEGWLVGWIAARLRIEPRRLRLDTPIARHGLDSLAAVELAHELESRLGASLQPAELLSATIADLAARPRLLPAARPEAEAWAALPDAGEPGALRPLSQGQKALWLLWRLEPESPAYNIAHAARVVAPLDAAALGRAWQRLLDRHPMLRSTFCGGTEPLRRVWARQEVWFRQEDARSWSNGELVERLLEEAHRPFDLEQGPLLRVHLFTLTGGEHALLLSLHHIAADLWSFAVLLDELRHLYAAETAGISLRLPDLAASYDDYVRWQAALLAGSEGQRLADYWQRQLAGAPKVLELPADRLRSARPSACGASHSLSVGPEVTAGLQAIAQGSAATLYMVLLATFQVLLYRYTGREDFLVGSPSAGRGRPELAGLVGYFVNLLVLRGNLAGEPTFGELLERVRQTVLGAFQHQEYPFALLVDEMRPEGGRLPLVQVTFALQQPPSRGGDALAAFSLGGPGRRLELQELVLESMPLRRRPIQFELALMMAQAEGGLVAAIDYDPALFDETAVARLGEHFCRLLAAVAADPGRAVSELPLMAESEQRQVLVEWNRTRQDALPADHVHEQVAVQAVRAPESVALVGAPMSLTYGELERRANRLAALLHDLGVGPEVLVGLYMERSPEMVVGALAVLKTGGAYVPLDPDYPRERLAFMLADTAAPVVLTQATLAGSLPAGVRALCLDGDWRAGELGRGAGSLPEVAPQGLAYMIYTSGSTGRPKGVAISHGSLQNLVHWHRETFAVHAEDRATQLASPGFDAAVWEVWPYLAAGASLHLVPQELRTSPEGLRDWLVSRQITISFLPTPVAEGVLGLEWPPGCALRALLTGGDRLHLRDRAGPACALVNNYGPTESTVVATSGVVGPGSGPLPPIGRPIANTRAYVLDCGLRPVPPGVTGELCLAGRGLARGYLGAPDLTAERFLPDPFGTEAGGRLYRTGDLCRHRPDGDIEFLGRVDHQVKIRGFRIEPGEVEAVLASCPGVREAAVLASRDARHGPRLVAWVAAQEGITAGQLRHHLAARLPDYMIPSAFEFLGALPLTPHGKVDRRELAVRSIAVAERYVAPRTPTEELLAALWGELFRIERVGMEDGFFELGGHSLMAARLTARLRQAYGVELPLQAVFEAPTVVELAARVEAARQEGPAGRGDPIERVPREGPLPLSSAQQRLWFLEQMVPGSLVYVIPVCLHLEGPLDVPALSMSLDEIVRRHEALRTAFPESSGGPVQVVLPAAPVALPVVDLEGLAAERRSAEVMGLAQDRQPFDLAQGPLVRTCLVRLRPERHTLLITLHHIVSDGWSMGVLVRELGILYGAVGSQAPSPLPELPLQYADFAVWQQRQLGSGALQSQLVYWRQKLAGAAVLELPTDRPRPAVQSFRGAVEAMPFPDSLAADLRAASTRRAATPFMTLLAGWGAVLARYSGQQDVVVGSPVAGRERPETKDLIGFFANTLVLRVDLAGDPRFGELLERVRDVCLEAYSHQDLPFERLVEDLQPERDLGRSPLFQVMLALEVEPPPLRLPGLEVSRGEWNSSTARFDVTLSLARPDGGLTGVLEYSTDLFDRATMRRLGGHFRVLLASALGASDLRLSELPLMPPAERRQVLVEWNQTARLYPSLRCVHELIAEREAHAPDAVALVAGQERLTYGELERRANRLAHRLRGLGVRPEVRVGLCMERSLEMVMGALAVLKAGGAYVPLDPEYPRERQIFMVTDTAAAVVLTQTALAGSLPDGVQAVLLDADWAMGEAETGVGPLPPAAPENLAYVIYTSGSTGRPKGVAVSHGSLHNLVHWHREAFAVDAEDRATQTASPGFDAAVWEIWPYLASGASIHFTPEEIRASAPRLWNWLAAEAVTITFLPTPLAEEMLLLAGAGPAALRWLLTGGDRLRLSAPPGAPYRLVNNYGPTESTVVATSGIVHGDGPPALPSIGRPIANTRVYLVDGCGLGPVPLGVPGELCLAGRGLARGYLGRPELTAERFVPDPFAAEGGGRLYRTGDLARHRADGELEFLGRLDQQVKIRGFRIEPGEIEAALARHSAVSEAVVVPRQAGQGEMRLVAYVVPAGAERPTAEELRRALGSELPGYMMPAAYVFLAALPLTSHGKIDRSALPAPPAVDSTAAVFVTPRTPLEELLAGAWADLLGVDRVGVHDGFFELGGHSLLAARLVSRLREMLGVELAVRAVFEAPTVAQLAGVVAAATAKGCLGGDAAIGRVLRDAALPLSSAQQRLWVLDRLEPGNPAYNLPAALRLRGPLDAAALAQALSAIVERHEVLRTVFPMAEGGPRQVIRAAGATSLPAVDLGALDGPHREAELERLAVAEARRPFDLAAGPLLRAALLRLAGDEHALLLALHHIVADAWSVGIFVRELGALYEALSAGRSSPLAELPIQYADFAVWERARLEAGVLQEQLAYWLEQLANPPVLELPADRPRPAVQSFRGATQGTALPAGLRGRLRSWSRQQGATLFMALLATFQALLARLSGQEDVLVGSPIAGRGHPESEGLIGLFLNILVLRADLSDDPSFATLLARVRETCLGAYAHQDLPFERLVEQLQPERSLSRTPLFQVMFALEMEAPMLRLTGLEVIRMEIGGSTAQFDLTLSLVDHGESLAGVVEYSTDLFERTTIQRIAACFEALLDEALAEPGRPLSQLRLLRAAERHQLLAEWNDTRSLPVREVSIHELFAAQARRSPDAVAAVHRGRELTYRELDEQANRLAWRLGQRGIGPGDRVGIAVERSLEMLVALLGTLAAGAAYVPLDPRYPSARLVGMLADAAVGLLVTHAGPAEKLAGHACPCLLLEEQCEAAASSAAIEMAVPAGSLAYVIYTSGSTGKPKGVMVGHREVANFFAAMDDLLGHEPPGVWLAVTSISFDISVLELLWALTRGFKVVIQDEAGAVARPAVAASAAARPIDFSLLYFADAGAEADDKYRLLLAGAEFADRHGFKAVWTPERHFHPFGGLYPNPSVTGAAVAAVTRRVAIRAGSVVLPLHDPLRVAEEWSVVDNLSRGRVGISFASGWHADDFVLAPDHFGARKEIMLREIDTVRRLWRGEPVRRRGGAGNEVEVRIHPRPVQAELPVWLTAAGNAETFRLAGEIGANVLTHLLGQSVEEVAEKIAVYREAWQRAGHPAGGGSVALMLHTFIGRDEQAVREKVRGPFTRYLESSVGLVGNLARSLGLGDDIRRLRQADLDALLAHAFDRYYETSSLLGTPESCRRMVERLRAIGVDEIACLIDFGVDVESVLASLREVAVLRQQFDTAMPQMEEADFSLPAQISRYGVSHLQCTPSMMAMLVAEPRTLAALRPLRKLLLGGEALFPALLEQLGGAVEAEIHNMYGPTETTVWSLTRRVEEGERRVPIGRPIRNTEVYLLDRHLQPVVMGVSGEVFLGGRGVAPGYWRRPDLTAERFLPDPFGAEPGGRLYRTGDLARHGPDGEIQFLGRIDHQVKVRGYRIELGEIEAALTAHPAVAEAVVTVGVGKAGGAADDLAGHRLVAYLVAAAGQPLARPLQPRGKPEDLGQPLFRLPNGLPIAHLSDFQTHTGYREIFEDEVYLRHGIALPDGACVFDVGANIGLFTLFVHQRCIRPRVFAFEPIPPTFEVLRDNIALYGLDVRLFNQGLAARAGRADFTFYANAPGLSGRFAQEDREDTRAIVLAWLEGKATGGLVAPQQLEEVLDEHLRGQTFSCELMTLSDVIREHGIERIDLLKVDVEKSELEVLSGIRDEDWDKIDQIVLEVHTAALLERISALLESKGYDLRTEDVAVVEGGGGRRGVHVHMLYAIARARRPEQARGRAGGAPLAVGELRRYLAERLPDYMIPAEFVVLDAFPLTGSGKIDRRALPAPGMNRLQPASVYVAPQTELERAITAVWQQVLGNERLGIHDNFFEIGGNSLLLVQLQTQLKQQLGRDVTMVEMFRHPTIQALSRHLAAQESARPSFEEVEDRARSQVEARQQGVVVERQKQFLEERRKRKTNPRRAGL